MNAIRPISRTDETVTLRLKDYEALISAVEDAEDVATLLAAGASEAALGKPEVRFGNLPDDLVGRLLDGEHPVRVWRKHRDLSAAALATAAGVSRSYLAEIETGKKPGSISAYRDLAAALHVTIDDIAPLGPEGSS